MYSGVHDGLASGYLLFDQHQPDHRRALQILRPQRSCDNSEWRFSTTLRINATHGRPGVVPSGGGLGADIRGVDLRRLGDDAFSEVHRAWLDNLVLRFRDQALTDAELIAFSRRFGELDLAPVQETGRRFVEGMPELYIVSNVLKDGEPIGSLGNGAWCFRLSHSRRTDHDLTTVALCLSAACFFSELVVGIISPLVFGRLLDWTGSWTIPLYGSMGLLLLGAVLSFFMRPDRPFVKTDASGRA